MHTSNVKTVGLERFLEDESATLEFGAQLARVFEPALTVYLRGDLGAGKTTLARGILRGLGFTGRVKSPTFSLVELYKFSKLYLYHFDFYRFDNPREFEDTGFREYFHADAVCLVEWPEKADGLPPADIDITIDVSGQGRTLRLSSNTEAGTLCLGRLKPQ